MTTDLSALCASLRQYARTCANPAGATAFLELAEEGSHALTRQRLDGHFTASAWLVSADGERTLLTHHRKLDRWLQPGGHADGDADLARVALREAEEETGVGELAVEGGIFDLDRHQIPARGKEPAHWHYDVRYVVRAGTDERFVVSEESHALAWREIAEVAADPAIDPSLRRMAQRWLQRT
ncbi:NUDIX hydrolase [Oleiagrimonas sp. C23AA]|uniref:NUDIX hydrolase n=1 Tax=Oleiagrimonas sp. C23AA TaxID=2719047 RepID=UPI001422F252|nr:NUDIX hydrolase [Oleiagrimonas sp. C23AA]NII10352.1 NUDIX hydrolase [Oleiagrimonas sp. C23AA]